MAFQRELDQGLADLSQTHSDGDQSAADLDSGASQRDSAASLSDQVSADVDQRASDADQASSDRELAAEPSPSAAQRSVHDESRAERDNSTGIRQFTEQSRTEGQLSRIDGEARRLEVAEIRDDIAAERDHAAMLRERSARRADAALLAAFPGNAMLEAAVQAHAQAREQAEADRLRAHEDRATAARDRERSAAERRQAQIDVQRAQLDSLTGVYLRELGFATLQHEIDRCRRNGDPLVLAFIDINGLKAVNDAQGHATGDALIRSVVQALRDQLRTYDPVVRVGGDEFLCGLPAASLQAAHSRVHAIRDAISNAQTPGSISVGYALLRDSDTLPSLVARADADMYTQKKQR